MHVLRLLEAFPSIRLESAGSVLRELRMIKDADEIELLRLAAEAADRVVAQIAAGPLVGRTEGDVAREVRERLLAEGHELAEFSIVGSGPNSASPHHEASDRVIGPGEPIVLDIGGALGGYGSDITRTLWVTGGDPARGPDEAFLRLFAVLRAAQAQATAAVAPGIACERVDAVARDLIAAKGYGAQFIHRTGHGIGLEGHEEPYIVAGNEEALRPGMAFSIEPGIYLEGRYGARLEDIVVCGSDGPLVLNRAPLDLYVVDGV
jgi:Xaa-Pro aminopeptidase